jgi:hypothetical protein
MHYNHPQPPRLDWNNLFESVSRQWWEWLDDMCRRRLSLDKRFLVHVLHNDELNMAVEGTETVQPPLAGRSLHIRTVFRRSCRGIETICCHRHCEVP